MTEKTAMALASTASPTSIDRDGRQLEGRGGTWPAVADATRGSVLLLGIIVATAFLIAMAAAVSTAITLGKDSVYALDQTRALSLSEGVTEQAQREVLEVVSNFGPVPSSGSVFLEGTSRPYAITAIGDGLELTDPDGVQRSVRHYTISASVNTGEGYATVARVVDLSMTPLFQYMIFYQDDLEILPGPNMTLGGRVHCNADMYVGSGNTLTVSSDYFRASGHIYRKRKNDGTAATGTVSIQVKDTANYANLNVGEDATYTDWTQHALDTWQGTVMDGSHGVKEVAAPDIRTIKAFNPDGTKGFFHENADLVVKDGLAYDRSGNLLAPPPGTITEKTMYDGREGKAVTVTEINVQLLNTSGIFPANGLVYAYRTDATASQPNGIRLTAGQELLSPMTLVSQDPVYVRGNFNTVNKKGASVMCDAINLLSSAWNDSKIAGSLPAASNTQFNLAIVTGNVPTPDGGGSYSGGFENLPRFHENWTGKTAKIRGSFVNIFESEVAKSPWSYGGSVYTAPVRDWAFDSDLLNTGNLPPFTPNAVYFERVLWDDGVPLPIE